MHQIQHAIDTLTFTSLLTLINFKKLSFESKCLNEFSTRLKKFPNHKAKTENKK